MLVLTEDTQVLTDKGWVCACDLRKGSRVLGSRGWFGLVDGIENVGRKDTLLLKTRQQHELLCVDSMVFDIAYFSNEEYKSKPESASDLLLDHSKGGNQRHRILAQMNPVKMPEKPLPCNPYVLGVIIGDGCCKERYLTIASDDDFVISKVARLLGAKTIKLCDKNCSYGFVGEDGKKLTTKNVLGKIPEVFGQGSGSRSIPDIYKIGSVRQRRSLLQGLFDTDGCATGVHKSHKPITFYGTTSKRLAEDTVELLSTLGLIGTISKCDRRGSEYETGGKRYVRKSVDYKVTVRNKPEDCIALFSLPRKRDVILEALKVYSPKRTKHYDHLTIESISRYKKKPCIGLKIAGTNQIFIKAGNAALRIRAK